MKLAYFILVHHKASQFGWLWQAVYSPDDVFCIHVDAKASETFNTQIIDLVGRLPNVIFLPRRSIAWSGWSMVEAELAAMRALSTRAYAWDYWINLSGQDYPLKSRAEIRNRLDAAQDSFIGVRSFDDVAAVEPQDPHLQMQAYIEFRGKIRKLPVKVPLPEQYRYKGSTWHMLRREFVEWVLGSDLSRHASRSVRFQFCPDEIFFQALIMNSPFREARTDCSRFVVWPGPKILDQSDEPAILQSDDLFGRKFDANVDAAILHRLAAHGGYAVPPLAG